MISHAPIWNPVQNRLWNLALFPFIKDVEWPPDAIQRELALLEDAKFEDLDYEAHLKACKNVLKPYNEKLSAFYYDDFECVFIALYKRFPIHPDQTLTDYLDALLSIPEHALTVALIKGFSADPEEEGTEMQSPESLLSAIRGLTLPDNAKWHLYGICLSPHEALRTLNGMFQSLEPEFDRLYMPLEARARAAHERITQQMRTEGPHKMTAGLLPDTVEQTTQFQMVTSPSFAYHILMFGGVGTGETATLMWGDSVLDMFAELEARRIGSRKSRTLMFKALGDLTRYEVLRYIAQGMTSTKKIAAALDVAPATISYHINTLTAANLIHLKQEGDKFNFAVREDALRSEIGALLEDMGITEPHRQG